MHGQVETLLCGFVRNTVSRGVLFCCLRLCALERQPSFTSFSQGGSVVINLQAMGGYQPRIIITISIKQAKVNNRNVLFAKSMWSAFSQTIQQQQLCWFIFSRFLWPCVAGSGKFSLETRCITLLFPVSRLRADNETFPCRNRPW